MSTHACSSELEPLARSDFAAPHEIPLQRLSSSPSDWSKHRSTTRRHVVPSHREIVLIALLMISLLWGVWRGAEKSSRLKGVIGERANAMEEGIAPPVGETVLKKIEITQILNHTPGTTALKNLYLWNGTWTFVHADHQNASDFPHRAVILTQGFNAGEDPWHHLPDNSTFNFLSLSEARARFALGAQPVDGVSWLINDHSWLWHYYHFFAELLFAAWQSHSMLYFTSPNQPPAPCRLVLPHMPATEFYDTWKINIFLLRILFPSMAIEYKQDFEQRRLKSILAADPSRPGWLHESDLELRGTGVEVWDRVIIVDRFSLFLGKGGDANFGEGGLEDPTRSPKGWWAPLRAQLVKALLMPEDPADLTENPIARPVITYISRQDWSHRALLPSSHEKLMSEMTRLSEENQWEFREVIMRNIDRAEQMRLAARTNIMMGVHGNGLTSLLWMRPTPCSTVIEFFFPQGYQDDYDFPSSMLGIKHYGVWNDTTFTLPEKPPHNLPDGFQSKEIPLDGEMIGRLVKERLAGWGRS